MEAGMTGLKMRRSTRSSPQGDARMGKVRRRFLNRGLRLHARDVPAAFPSGNLCQFWKGVNAKLKRGVPRRGDRDHRKPTATTNLGNLGIPSGRAPH